jgi:hypothetical protein
MTAHLCQAPDLDEIAAEGGIPQLLAPVVDASAYRGIDLVAKRGFDLAIEPLRFVMTASRHSDHGSSLALRAIMGVLSAELRVRRAGRPSHAAAVSLPPLREPCHDWSAGGGRRLPRDPGTRCAGMVALGRGPHCFSNRRAQPHHGSGLMALVLLNLPARQPPHHWFRTLTRALSLMTPGGESKQRPASPAPRHARQRDEPRGQVRGGRNEAG